MRLATLLILLLAGTARADTRVSIAVTYFDNTANDAASNALQKGIADMLITDLSVSEDLRIVERGRLQQVLGELKLQKLPYIDKTTAAKLGKGLAAAYLVTGAYFVKSKQMRIDVRVVDVASSEVVFTTAVDGPLDDFFKVQAQLGEKVLGGLGAKLTLLQKKKLGSSNTTNLVAFTNYSMALDAQDRGDSKAEKVALQKALTADPGFSKVQERLDALEARVAALEKSGGRIMTPTSARDFFHNARIQKGEGDYKGALASLHEAARKEPDLADIWLLAAEVSPAPFATDVLDRDPELRTLVNALHARDVAALDAALRGNTKRKAQAAAFSFSLLRDKLPSKSLETFAMAKRACRELLTATGKSAFVDELAFLDAVRKVDSRYFAKDTQVEEPAVMSVNRAGAWSSGKIRMWWLISAAIYERPQGAVTMTLVRDPAHPSNKGTLPPPWTNPISEVWHKAPPKQAKEMEAKMANPNTLVYESFDWSGLGAGQRSDSMRVGKFGDSITVPQDNMECKDESRSLTGSLCTTWMYFHIATLPPGAYVVTLSYKDPEGRETTRRGQVIADEFDLTPDHYNQTHIVLHARSGDSFPSVSFKPEYKIRMESFYGDWGAEEIYFDIDLKLVGGKLPQTTAEYVAYRELLLRKGHKVPADSVTGTTLPLPKLKNGKHWVCVSGKRKNGSVTPEAECKSFELEEEDD